MSNAIYKVAMVLEWKFIMNVAVDLDVMPGSMKLNAMLSYDPSSNILYVKYSIV